MESGLQYDAYKKSEEIFGARSASFGLRYECVMLDLVDLELSLPALLVHLPTLLALRYSQVLLLSKQLAEVSPVIVELCISYVAFRLL